MLSTPFHHVSYLFRFCASRGLSIAFGSVVVAAEKLYFDRFGFIMRVGLDVSIVVDAEKFRNHISQNSGDEWSSNGSPATLTRFWG